MATKPNELELNLYPLDADHYIAKIYLGDNGISSAIETFVVLDISGSMGTAVELFVQKVMPLVMSKLSYKTTDQINLITFSSKASIWKLSAEKLKSSGITCAGCTNFGPAIETLLSSLSELKTNVPIRLLTISDGEIGDQVITEQRTKNLVEFLEKNHFTINSQAVRLFTSDNQPDTKALSCLLQINNTTPSKLLDIRSTEPAEDIANKIAALFQSDNFTKCQMLEFNRHIILKFPWGSTLSRQILLVNGWNVFLLKLGQKSVAEVEGGTVGCKRITVIMHEPVTLAMFQSLMAEKLNYIVDHMKILKIIGTTEANQSVNQIVEYFELKEKQLAQGSTKDPSNKMSNILSGIAQNSSDISDSKAMARFLQSNAEEVKKQMEKLQEEAKRKQEAAEQEAKRKREAAEQEAKRKQEAAEQEAKRKQEAAEQVAKRKQEEAELEAKRKREAAEQEAKRKEEEEREAKRKQEEAEQEAKRKEEEEREAKRKQEAAEREAKRKQEEAEQEAKRKQEEAEQEARRKQEEAEQEAKRKQEEAEQEAKRKQEEAEQEAKRKEEEEREAKRKQEAAEQEAKRKEEAEREAKRKATQKNSISLVSAVANIIKGLFFGTNGIGQDNDSNSTQVVVILDESAEPTSRFTEEIIPLVLSELPYEKSELIPVFIFGKDKTIENELQPLWGTLDVNKPIKLLVLTNGDIQGNQGIENCMESLAKFFSDYKVSADSQVLRFASKCQRKTKYNIIDIDANESNEFIASSIAELFHSGVSFAKQKQLRMDKQIYKIQGESAFMGAEYVLNVGDKKSGNLVKLESRSGTQSRRSNRTCGTCPKSPIGSNCLYLDILLITFAILLLRWIFDY